MSLERLIRSYDSAISVRGVAETEAVLRSICEVRPKTSDPDLVAVNNGVYDYDKKFLYDFDPGFVFTSKSHVNFKETRRTRSSTTTRTEPTGTSRPG